MVDLDEFGDKCPPILARFLGLTGDFKEPSHNELGQLLFVKDLGIVTDTAQSLKFPLYLGSTAYQMFTSASNDGHGGEDDSAVIKIFKGISLPEK